MNDKKDIAIITFAYRHGRKLHKTGSSTIRGEWIANNWDRTFLWKVGEKFNHLILQKVYWPEMAKLCKGKVVLDLCDPDWMKADYTKDTYLKIVEAVKEVDVITTSTIELQKVVKQFAGKIPVINIPDRVDLKIMPDPKKHTDSAKEVLWFGYSHNARIVLPQALESLAKNNLRLRIISDKPYSGDNRHGIEIIYQEWIADRVWHDMQQADFVINPKPLITNFRFKSNNKTLIAWGLGLPVAEFRDDMDRFLDPAERQKEADARYQEVKDSWTIEKSVAQYKDIFR